MTMALISALVINFKRLFKISTIQVGDTGIFFGGAISSLMMKRRSLLLMLLVFLGATQVEARGIYEQPEAFLARIFANQVPEPSALWLTGELKQQVKQILGHEPYRLRERYWKDGQQSVWILEEIGKTKPITIGFVISEASIKDVKVLIFRESRGWEIRHGFFSDQYLGAQLDADTKLDRHIDGVSGATLSVNAMTKLSRLALLLDRVIRQ